MESLMGNALKLVARRIRLCKHAPICPKCRTKQVQLFGYKALAKWKCRECKHKWWFEPLILIK